MTSRQVSQQTDCTAANQPDTQASKQTGRPAGKQTKTSTQTDRLDKQTLTVACLGLTPVRASLSDTLEAVGRVAGLTAFHPIRQCCNTVIVHMLHYRMMKTHFTQPTNPFHTANTVLCQNSVILQNLFCHVSFRPGFTGANMCQGKQTTT